MKKIAFLVCLALSINMKAQLNVDEVIPSKTDIEKIKSNTMVVVLFSENQEYIQTLTKKNKTEDLAFYKKSIESYNANIKEVIPKFFNIAKEIKFLNIDEVAAMMPAEKKEFSFLVFNVSASLGGNNDMNTKSNNAFAWQSLSFDFYNSNPKSKYTENYKTIHFSDDNADYTKMEIYLRDTKNSDSKMVGLKNYPNIAPTKADLIHTYRWLSGRFKEVAEGKKKVEPDGSPLKQKTLYICSDNLNKKLTEAEIKKKYKYKFKIVSKEEFDNALINQDSSVCLLYVMPMVKTAMGGAPTGISAARSAITFGQIIMDAKTGTVCALAFAKFNMGGVGSSYDDVKAKHFDDYLKYIK